MLKFKKNVGICVSQLHVRPYLIGYIDKYAILDHMYRTELDNILKLNVYVEISILN